VLKRDGLRLHYEIEGEGSPILFVHSATSSGSHEWGTLVEKLSDGYRCIVPDLRSHGRSDHVAGNLGLDAVLEDLRALLAHETTAPPHVVGFSFGAEVALELEIRHPGSTKSLTLVSPGTGHPRGVPRSERMAIGWPRSLRDLHLPKHGPDQWRTILDALSADAVTRDQIPDEVLSAIRSPILLVVGSKDQPIRIEQARHLARLNGLAQLVVVDGSGHAAHKARPELVLKEVVSFLAASEVANH
jgi:3-oxoadipate enol-lactonase